MRPYPLQLLLIAALLAACNPATARPTPTPVAIATTEVKVDASFEAQVAATGTALHQTALAPTLTPALALSPSPLPSLPASPLPTLSPTPLPSLPPAPLPSALPDATPAANSVSFSLYPPDPKPGEPLSFAWAVAEASAPTGGHCLTLTNDSGDLVDGAVRTWCDLPATGSLTLSVPTENRDRFRVYLDGGLGKIDVRLPCPDPYFFDIPTAGDAWALGFAQTHCADQPRYADAVEQAFEGGRLLALDQKVYALLGSSAESRGAVQLFDAATPFTDTTPAPLEVPAGKYPPAPAVFENVWRYEHLDYTGPAVREALGWAVAPPQTFQSVVESPWQTRFAVSASGDLENQSRVYPYFSYVRLSDGRAIFVSLYIGHGMQPYWAYLNP
jgi:hypothetical protein